MDVRSLTCRGTQLGHAVVRGEAGPPEVLGLLHEGIGADLASLSTFETGAPGGVLTRGRPPIEGPEEEQWRRLLPGHPYFDHVVREASPSPRLTDVVDLTTFTGTEVYTDLLRPWGARYQAMVVLERSASTFQVLSLWRRRRDFSDAEVDVLVGLGRTLAAASAYRRTLEELRRLPDADHAAGPDAGHDARPDGDLATGLAGRLTPRQRQVVELVSEGLTNEQVATRLGLSARTVRKHVEALFAVTGARSRTQLAVVWRSSTGW